MADEHRVRDALLLDLDHDPCGEADRGVDPEDHCIRVAVPDPPAEHLTRAARERQADAQRGPGADHLEAFAQRRAFQDQPRPLFRRPDHLGLEGEGLVVVDPVQAGDLGDRCRNRDRPYRGRCSLIAFHASFAFIASASASAALIGRTITVSSSIEPSSPRCRKSLPSSSNSPTRARNTSA